MLSAGEKDHLQEMLSRFSTISEGETVVANLLRSLEGRIVPIPLAEIVLKAWCARVRDADAASKAIGFGPLSAESALRYTESEFISTTTPSPLWDTIRRNADDPFRLAASGTVSNVKTLSAVMEHLLGVTDLSDPHSGVPIPLSHHIVSTRRSRQADRIKRALLSHKLVKTGARIHHRRWFWVTTSRGLADALHGLVGDDAATKAVDILGLVHFSRRLASQSVAERYVVEVQLTSSFARESAKPSFIFGDHNPRFVAWTDPIARADPLWGRAADLAKYHIHVRLEHGSKEMVKATPNQILATDVIRLNVLGYLDVNRWGASDVAEGTEVFADRLRLGRSKAEVVDTVLSLL